MFAYYIQLGLRSLRRNPILTALMVLGIGLGIAASMTTLTVMHLMGADPIPWKSSKLHYVQLDNWDVNNSYYDDGRPPDQVTYRDATALMAAGKADKQAAMWKIALPIQPENPEVKPFNSLGRVTYADFFPMFEPPFAYGGPWDRKQDDEHARVIVLTKDTNEKLFGGQNSVGTQEQLTAKAAADERRHEVDFLLVDTKRRCKVGPPPVDHLAGSPDRQLVAIPGGDGGMRLHHRMRLVRRCVGLVQCHLGGLERTFEISHGGIGRGAARIFRLDCRTHRLGEIVTTLFFRVIHLY